MSFDYFSSRRVQYILEKLKTILDGKAASGDIKNGTLTIQKNGTNVQTFSANQSSNATANITVPTKTSDLTNDSGYITNPGVTGVKGHAESSYRLGDVNITPANIGLGNVGNFKAVSTVSGQNLSDTEKSNARTNIGAGTGNGTITGIKMNGASKGSSGVVDLGTVITSHQDISGKANTADLGDGAYKDSGVYYGTCATAAATKDKEVTVSADQNFTLKVGAVVHVKFTNTNTYSATADNKITLNVNSTGAKVIYFNNSNAPTGTNTTAFGSANWIMSYMYDGTYWVWVGYSGEANSDTKVTQTNTTGNADYRVLFSENANDTTQTVAARKNTSFKYNPSTGNLMVTKLNGVTIGSSPKFTDTTYESKAAASGGTDVSLVTTGEKATWNAKGSGTITGIKMNGASKGTSGVVDLGTVITAHQDISGKADKSATVSTVAWDSTNKKITKTINGTTTDVVSAATILGNLTSAQVTTALGFTPISSDTTKLPLAGGTMTGRITSPKPNNFLITGSGTTAQDKGSGVSPRYFPAKWTFNTGKDPVDGDIITIKIPCAGHDYGVFVSINNGTSYHPVRVDYGTGRLTTHYGNGQYITLIYTPNSTCNNVYAAAGADARSNITGCWTVLNWYDSNTTPSAYCSTAAGTQAKGASCTNYNLLANSYIHVIMTNANSYNGAITLNINGKGAKPIYINGAASSSSNKTLPAGSYLVFYNGTNYYFRTDGKITTTGLVNTSNAAIYTNNAGTITGITMNGASKGTSGVVDLGTVLTSHQDISGKADKSATVSTVEWDSTNNKLTKTINGTTTDVVSAATILGNLTSAQVTTALGGYIPKRPIKWNNVIFLNSDSATPLNLCASTNVDISKDDDNEGTLYFSANNNKVTQNVDESNAGYALLLSNTSWSSSETAACKKNNGLTYNPNNTVLYHYDNHNSQDNILIYETTADVKENPSSTRTVRMLRISDKNWRDHATIETYTDTSGVHNLRLRADGWDTSGNWKNSCGITLAVTRSGGRMYGIDDPKAFRSALGMHTWTKTTLNRNTTNFSESNMWYATNGLFVIVSIWARTAKALGTYGSHILASSLPKCASNLLNGPLGVIKIDDSTGSCFAAIYLNNNAVDDLYVITRETALASGKSIYGYIMYPCA